MIKSKAGAFPALIKYLRATNRLDLVGQIEAAAATANLRKMTVDDHLRITINQSKPVI